jgi:hypothetical protein
MLVGEGWYRIGGAAGEQGPTRRSEISRKKVVSLSVTEAPWYSLCVWNIITIRRTDFDSDDEIEPDDTEVRLEIRKVLVGGKPPEKSTTLTNLQGEG